LLAPAPSSRHNSSEELERTVVAEIPGSISTGAAGDRRAPRRRSFTRRAAFAALLGPLLLGAQAFLTSASHVKANGYLSRSAVRPGDRVAAAVVLEIRQGYHVNAHQPTLDYLIPTTLEVEAPEGISVEQVRYPKPRVQKFGFSEEPLAVYEGRAVLRFDLMVDRAAKLEARKLRGKVRLQACDHKACYAPASLEVEIPVPLVAKGVAVHPTHPELFKKADP
jgi:thiol:disulfide interchange protein DsbD